FAKKQDIDWSEFYPLRDGDFWKYEGNAGVFPTTSYKRVVKDTVLHDSNMYKMVEYHNEGGPVPSEGIYSERLEYNIVYSWQSFDTTINRIYKFSACIGDTFGNNFTDFYWRINDKNYDMFHLFMYPDLTYSGDYFVKRLGLYERTFEG